MNLRLRNVLILSALLLGSPFRVSGEIPEKDLQKAASQTESGTQAMDKGDLKGAQERFDKALSLVPAFPDALLGVGHLRLKEGKFAEALAAYLKARDAYPELGKAIFNIRVRSYDGVQRQMANYRSSLQALRAQMAGKKSDPTALERQIAQVEEALRKLQLVQPPTQDTASEAPGEVYFHIGNAHFRLNALDEAILNWETCATRSPAFANVHNNLTVAYWKKGRFDDAKRHLARAAELGFPVNPQMKADLEKAAAAAPKP